MIGLNSLVRILVSSILTAMISTAPDTVTTISLVNILTQPNELVTAVVMADDTAEFTEDSVSMESIDMISAIMQMQQADVVTEEVTVVADAAEAEAYVEAVQTETAAAEIYLPAEISVETQIAESFAEPVTEVAAVEDDWLEVTEDWQDDVAADVIENVEIPETPQTETPEVQAPVYEETVIETPAEVPVEAPAEIPAEVPVEEVWNQNPENSASQIPEEEYVEPEEEWYEPEEWNTAPEVPSAGWSGSVLTPSAGVVTGPNGRETYYNLDMSGVVSIMQGMGYDYEYWVRDDGVKMYGDYVMVAANLDTHPRGSIYETSLGYGIVCDTGSFAFDDPYQTDIAVNW